MIVWVNGAFGAGKTTLVEEVRGRWPEALVYDPEMIGFVLRRIVAVPTGDFQDLRLWRRQVVSLAVGLVEEYGRPVLVPMTLVDPGYAAEIFGELAAAGVAVHHFFLDVSAEVLARRIGARVLVPDDPERDEAARRWGLAQIERCAAAVGVLPAGTVLLDGERSPAELAGELLARVGQG
ncbi:ATP-binding protein [Streptomyces sp. LP05-1]|uniref:ATP-binding protein n=1 Tax=Streptomyces pyxinae TaxID=2970734 RepID=A0ABT2CPC7_9ACTN|nr:ATP-binding protein [Streptomyces sp. LP05-1]MCS0639111.1 ATP-binding protein [Streptomyces sp. LP05-1]